MQEIFFKKKKIIEAFEESIFSMSKEVLHKNQIEKQVEKQTEEKKKRMTWINFLKFLNCFMNILAIKCLVKWHQN